MFSPQKNMENYVTFRGLGASENFFSEIYRPNHDPCLL